MSNDNRVFLSNSKPVGDDETHKELTPSGMQKDYVVLSEEERKKGFVRPVRRSYWHVGVPVPVLRDLTEEEKERAKGGNYAKYEEYGPERAPKIGKFWTQAEIDRIGKGCQGMTTMGQALAETYARNPHFYSGTFCAHCGVHYPVGENGEFTWSDGTRVGT